MALAMTLSILTARKFLDKRELVSLGLRWDSSSSRDILVGVGIAGIMMSTIFAAEWLFHLIKVEQIVWETPDGSSVVGGLLLWFVIFAFVAWNEELYSRGYLLQNLAEGFNLPMGILFSSVIFSMAHLLNPSPSIMSVIGIIAAGLFFAFSYVRTQRLWLAMGLHLGWNFFEGPIYGFPVSGLETVKLIQHTPSGPEIITGGAFGPEAGVILYPALAIGTALIYLYTRYNVLVSED